MGFQDDWIIRQVEMITRYVARLLFGKNDTEYTIEESDTLSEEDGIYIELDSLLGEGKICEAEDMLFDNIRITDRYVELAVDFYKKLNKMSDNELENSDFSRDEVLEGYVDILTRLGIPVEQFVE